MTLLGKQEGQVMNFAVLQGLPLSMDPFPSTQIHCQVDQFSRKAKESKDRDAARRAESSLLVREE